MQTLEAPLQCLSKALGGLLEARSRYTKAQALESP